MRWRVIELLINLKDREMSRSALVQVNEDYFNTIECELIESVTDRMAQENLRPFGSGRSGYGKKIATSYKVRWGNRFYRVYSTCYSNVSTEYIIVKDVKHRVRFYC
jgi:hypothetical protein